MTTLQFGPSSTQRGLDWCQHFHCSLCQIIVLFPAFQFPRSFQSLYFPRQKSLSNCDRGWKRRRKKKQKLLRVPLLADKKKALSLCSFSLLSRRRHCWVKFPGQWRQSTSHRRGFLNESQIGRHTSRPLVLCRILFLFFSPFSSAPKKIPRIEVGSAEL